MASNLAIKSDENETSGLVKRIDNLENLLKSNLDQFNILSQSLDNLNKNLENKGTVESVTLGPQQFGLLSQTMSDHLKISEITNAVTTLGKEVAKAADVQIVGQQVSDLKTVLADVQTTSHKIDNQVGTLSKDNSTANIAMTTEPSQIQLNSEKSLCSNL